MNKILIFVVAYFISITVCAQISSRCTSLDEAADLMIKFFKGKR